MRKWFNKTDWEWILLIVTGAILWFALIGGVLLGYEI